MDAAPDSPERADPPAASADAPARPPTPQAWVPGDVPESIAPPPSLEELADDVEAAWMPRARPQERDQVPLDTQPSARVADVAALGAVGVAGLVLVFGAMVPVGRRVAELSASGVADPGVRPALVALTAVLVFSAASFAWVLRPWTRGRRVGAVPRRTWVLAWAWGAAALVLASARVTGSFAVFGDPIAGAIEDSPSGRLLGGEVSRAMAVGVIWACLYGLVVAPVLALVFARLEARGRLDGVELVLTRSGPVLQAGRPGGARETPVADDAPLADDAQVVDDVPDRKAPDS